MQNLPFSQACENNKQPILNALKKVFEKPSLILEIGTGTGQHAVHFATYLPHLHWQPSDHPDNADQCVARLQQSALSNIRYPWKLDVSDTWPEQMFDGVFSANTAHIMSWSEVETMYQRVSEHLHKDGQFCLYGPFNYLGCFTSPSNERFDQYLKSQAVHMGIRDMEDLLNLGVKTGLTLESDIEMPANNRLLVWRRSQ